MANHQEPYQERNSGKKNDAELYAMQYYKNRKINIIRAGFDIEHGTVPPKLWNNIPKYIRNLPDFIIMSDKGNFFLECKGGTSNVKFKISELKSYGFWNDFIPVVMFVWSSTYGTIYRVKYINLMDLIEEQNYEIGEYDNQEKYHIIPMADLTLKVPMDKAPKLEKE
tara:strand:+ start:248 stop:748 length:501 start_codon:yes stop_codon:yes gene_type:complete